MALDWSNERYVRLYRATVDHAALCWQARAIWPLVLQAADGAGVIETTKGARGVAVAINVPLEVVDPGLVELVEDGCVVLTATGYAVPNYIEAQTAISSPNQRAARYRDRERAREALESRGVTPNHAASRNITERHAGVTPIRTDPDRSEVSLGGARARDPSAPAPGTVPPPAPPPAFAPMEPLVSHAIDRLNAARLELDAAAPPIAAAGDAAGVRSLCDRLRPISEADRLPTLNRALDVLIATVRAEGKPVGDLRLGMLAGEKSWPRWIAGTVESIRRTARGRDGPGGARASPRGQAAASTAPRIDGEQIP